jgi:hypothetical protein
MDTAQHLRHTWSVVGCRRTHLVSLGCAPRRAYEKREAKRAQQRFDKALAGRRAGIEPVFTPKAKYSPMPSHLPGQSARAE